jgi:hypothetical protein
MVIRSMWSATDIFTFSSLAVPALVLLFDLRISLTQKLSNLLSGRIKRESVAVIISIIYVVICLLVEKELKYISYFFAIVDYSDARTGILRANIISAIVSIYAVSVVLSPITCGILAKRKGKSIAKWSFYGFVMNVYGLIYLPFLLLSNENAHNK